MTIPLVRLFRWGVRGKRLTPAWEFPARGVIWRLLPTVRGQFVGEERNTPEKSVSFFSIRQDNGKVLWSGVRLIEPWWIGIEAIHDGVVLLHEFAVPDFPDHKKIHALDLSTGGHLWSNEETKYLFGAGDSIYAAAERDGVVRYVSLDCATGRERGEVEASEIAVLRRRAHSEAHETVEFPFPFDRDADRGEGPGRRIESVLLGSERIQFIEYIEKQRIIALGYYTLRGEDELTPTMDHHFVIAEQGTGRILHHDVLNAGVSAAVPDTFFAIGDMIFTIAEKKTLKAFDVSPEGIARG